jgi:methylase of polypeptide subunit release factors
MLMLGDPVTAEEARSIFGNLLLEKLIDAGLIAWAEGVRLVSPFRMVIGNDLFIVCDDLMLGENAVMGAGDTTNTLCQASHPTHPIERLLDLGCGAGSCALLFAGRAAHVVGTDINSRAITLSKVNAALNGITNIEFREGDVFAPVEGEAFDLIVSQPPYYARPDGVAGRSSLYGGARGDEFALKVLSQVPRYLSPGGRAVLLAEWPDIDVEPLEDRVRAVVPASDANVLFLKYPSRGVDDYCTRYAAFEHPDLGDDFAREAVLRREHLEKMGIRGLTMTLVVIQRNAEGLRWTSTFEVPKQDANWTTSERIDKLVSARDLVAAGRPNLLTARLRVPEGTVFAKECRSGQPDRPKFTARFPPEALVGTLELSSGALLLVTLLDEAPDVRSAVQRFAEREALTFDEASVRLLPALEEALLASMLEVA